MSASVNRFFSARDDVVGDHVGGRVDGERVEAARGPSEVQQRAGPLGRHEAHRRLGGVALRIEHDHRAAVPAQVLGDARHEVARLALLDRAGHGRVLFAQLDVDRHRPERVAQRPRAVGRAEDRRRRRRKRQRRPREGHRHVVDRRQLPDRRELGRGEHARAKRWQRITLAALRLGGRRGRAARVGRPCRARRGGSRPPRHAARRRSARSTPRSRATTRMSAKNSARCWTSSPPRSSESSSIERSRGRRCSLRSRERRASCRRYRCFASRSNEAGAGVSATCTKAGSPHAPITVISRFIGGRPLVLEAVQHLDALDELRPAS